MNFYSKSTGGFYLSAIHGEAMPSDVVEISSELHQSLLAAQAAGKTIQAGEDGYPIAVEPSAPTAEALAASIDFQRAAAYREEADPLFFQVQRGEAEHAEWIAKIAEIKARYPKEPA